MIPGIFNHLQKDLDTVLNVDPAKAHSRQEKDRLEILVGFAGTRVFGAVCMGLGTLITFSAIPVFVLTGAISQLILGVAIYAIGHDVFKFCLNTEKHLNSLFTSFREIGHFFVGGELARRQYHVNKMTEGLLLQFIAAPLLTNYLNNRLEQQLRTVRL